MPVETVTAINWALTQNDSQGELITRDSNMALVDKVREYFNINDIVYLTFSYDDLTPLFD